MNAPAKETVKEEKVTAATLVAKVASYHPDTDKKHLKYACDFAIEAHGSQKRHSGAPYYQHPLEVADILANMKLDINTIITALLHDTVEDTDVTLDDIREQFGDEVCKLVDGVTKLTKIEFQPDYIRQAENFRKLLLAMSQDIRVLLVKLADRLHNMQTIKYIRSAGKRRRISLETMEIYAPLAERIGIHTFKNELQDLAFAELHPEARSSIVSRLEFLRQEEKVVVEKIVAHITDILKGLDVEVAITGREKTPCSIWQKMELKNVSFEQLSDIMAFRILTETTAECYEVLGAIHSAYHTVPGKFKDYISTPKANDYQSIHTVVMGPEQQRIEVQIRTHRMHRIAEYGVAAHWSYKEGSSYAVEGRQYRWIRELLDILEHTSSPEEFMENTKLEMHYDQVFCFTPKGTLLAFPVGSTTVDFAYAVHSDIGNSCVGAKVNGRIVPLRTQLHNGDQIEIICSKTQKPSPSWEKFVVTGKARAEIRRFIRAQQRDEYLNLGKAMLGKALNQNGRELSDKILEPILPTLHKKSVSDLYVAIGEGTLSRTEVLKVLLPGAKHNLAQNKNRFSFLRFRKEKKKGDALLIKGLIPGMALHFAGCCHPIPGDKIVGIVHTGKGVTIHTSDCEMLENYSASPECWIDVAWDKESSQEHHVGRIKVILSHEAGSLATLANSIARDMGNINNIRIVNRSQDFFEIIVDIDVRGSQHLANIITSLRARSCVHAVERYKR